ncbi:MAG: shikimate kinase [Verrucomicrobia bacterium GWC2_42_7]|nr:MAG: shikimate kinase [Verrucomicrobia bacterium GWC2_42_7]
MLDISNIQPNLYIIGFMGTGKSVIGKRVASSIRFEFIDTDSVIEAEENISIREMFNFLGESHFRQMERKFIETGHPPNNCVVSCGGGLAVQPGMLDLLKQKGIVISLFASTQVILSRVLGKDKRPLLNVDNPEEKILALLKEREKFYLEAGTAVSTDNRSIPEIVDHIRRIYLRESQSWIKKKEYV